MRTRRLKRWPRFAFVWMVPLKGNEWKRRNALPIDLGGTQFLVFETITSRKLKHLDQFLREFPSRAWDFATDEIRDGRNDLRQSMWFATHRFQTIAAVRAKYREAHKLEK